MHKPLMALTVGLFVCLGTAARAGTQDGRLDIYWVDVEGGAATLIVTPAGESVLIDTGNAGHRDADRIFQTATRAARLRQIDHLIVTHYHSDHFGGAATLARVLPIKHVYDNGIFEGIRERPDEAYLTFKAEDRSAISPGDEISLQPLPDANAPSLALRCLAARQEFIPLTPGSSGENECCAGALERPIDNSDNANSIVTLLSYGPFRFFDAGDLTWNVEKGLVCPANRVGKVDVYQVTHHGLDSSNNPVVIRSLEPTVAVFNNGVTKGCEPYTFAALKETPSVQAIYQLHRNLRADSVNNTADENIANTQEGCNGNYVKLSVDPSGKTYTLSIPARGHERTFQTK